LANVVVSWLWDVGVAVDVAVVVVAAVSYGPRSCERFLRAQRTICLECVVFVVRLVCFEIVMMMARVASGGDEMKMRMTLMV
jgi:hypothetical protein